MFLLHFFFLDRIYNNSYSNEKTKFLSLNRKEDISHQNSYTVVVVAVYSTREGVLSFMKRVASNSSMIAQHRRYCSGSQGLFHYSLTHLTVTRDNTGFSDPPFGQSEM